MRRDDAALDVGQLLQEEAARAGEHGRGFAVVADEVRKLAERSGTQTKEIALLIAQLQTVTLQAVEAMEAGSREVEAGTQLAAEAGESLERIKVAVDGVARQVVEVSSATETINTSSADVGQAMETVAALTEETSAAAEAMQLGIEHGYRRFLEVVAQALTPTSCCWNAKPSTCHSTPAKCAT